jgi:hypothetical protein
MTTYIAKVYKLTNSVDDKWYLGSTKDRLAKRIGGHRSAVRAGKTSNIYNHMRTTGIENWVITLIEQRSVPDKEHQLMFERAKLDELKDEHCLNMCRPHITAEEKTEQARARVAAWTRVNPERHRATVARILAENRHHCAVCNYSAASPADLRKHNRTRKHQLAVEQAEAEQAEAEQAESEESESEEE